MKFYIHIWFLLLSILFLENQVIGQNVKLDINTSCANSTLCNPFVNGYACQNGVIRSTHGSPAFYLPSTNQTRQIQLEATIGTTGTIYGEGFTLAYPFRAGVRYRVKINHMGMPPQPGSTGSIFPMLKAALTNEPPRYDDGCDLGYLTNIDIVAQHDFTISASATTSSFDIQPTIDVGFLWLRSHPLANAKSGVLIFSIEITDYSVPPDPPAPNRPECGDDDWNFCHPNHNWAGSGVFQSAQTIYLHCDAFTTAFDPGSGQFFRIFRAPTMIFSDGFRASAYDYAVENPLFQAIAVAFPCGDRRNVSTVYDTVKSIKRDIKMDLTEVLDNVIIYPSPSKGLIKIFGPKNFTNGEITVIDQSGRTAYQLRSQASSNIIELNLQNLANGVYYIRIKSNSKSIVKKLVVSK